MMRWSFYRADTGEFTGDRYSAPDDSMLDVNTPAGCIAVEGHHDHLSKRVVDGRVVDYQPPKPSVDHEWNGSRWVLNASAVARNSTRARALARIADLERRAIRPSQELQLNPDDAEARARLADLRAQIAAQRVLLA